MLWSRTSSDLASLTRWSFPKQKPQQTECVDVFILLLCPCCRPVITSLQSCLDVIWETLACRWRLCTCQGPTVDMGCTVYGGNSYGKWGNVMLFLSQLSMFHGRVEQPYKRLVQINHFSWHFGNTSGWQKVNVSNVTKDLKQPNQN